MQIEAEEVLVHRAVRAAHDQVEMKAQGHFHLQTGEVGAIDQRRRWAFPVVPAGLVEGCKEARYRH